MAFMQVCGIDQTSDKLYETCSTLVDKAIFEIQRVYLRSRDIGRNGTLHLLTVSCNFQRMKWCFHTVVCLVFL